MTTKHKLQVDIVSDTQVTMTRDFNAPRSSVFRAFTDPDLIPRWWGQRGSTVVVDALDLRPGGKWRYVVTEQGGERYAFRGEYKEVDPVETLAYTFEFEPMEGSILLETDRFTESGDVTTVDATLDFDSVEQREAVMSFGMEAGAAESYGRLEELLAALE